MKRFFRDVHFTRFKGSKADLNTPEQEPRRLLSPMPQGRGNRRGGSVKESAEEGGTGSYLDLGQCE